MKIGIAHFTDMHFTVKSDMSLRLHSLVKTLINDFHQCEVIYFILSGDIANSGRTEEYEKAKTFFSSVKLLLNRTYNQKSIKYIIVPGNHDCNVTERDSHLRKTIINNINYSAIGNDSSVIDLVTSAQEDFWSFYSHYQVIPSDKLYYTITDDIGKKSICFHCLNTGWMSQRQEKPGTLFFPVKRYTSGVRAKHDINIGVWHHPYNWYTPNTVENNKKEFEKFTESIASLHFLGHEHEQEFYLTENLNTSHKTHLISGTLFNEDSNPEKSGYQTVIVDIDSCDAIHSKYEWKESIYTSSTSEPFSLLRDVKDPLSIKETFLFELNKIKIPLNIPNKKDLRLSDVFVYPDLEKMVGDSDRFDNYLDASKLIGDEVGSCIIDGEDQIGKSSLMNMLFLKFYELGLYPLLLRGRDIKEPDLPKLISKGIREQYNSNQFASDLFLQLAPEKRVLLIDDYHHCEFNSLTTQSILDEGMSKFGKVIIAIDSGHSLLPTMQAEFEKIAFYTIKPLGYKKRNELIERYHYLKSNPYTYDEQELLNATKDSFDNVQGILGDKLIPSYPLFILSILQALEYKPLKHHETSFGYCYQTLIHYSLHTAGVSHEYIDTYLNILTELAFEFIKKDTEEILESDFEKFFFKYKEKYLSPSYDVVIGVLKVSKILNFEDSKFSFGYNYILYYLSAKKISDVIHTSEGRKIVEKLFGELHIERSANILVFITHHSKDISFIEESLLNSMLVLDKISPISLEKDDPFYSTIKGIASDVTKDILHINRNPTEERNKQLQLSDQIEREREKAKAGLKDQDSTEIKEVLLTFQKSFRSIEIVGQIVKNRKGSLEIRQLHEMIKEGYTTGFRTVSYISKILLSTKEDLIQLLNKDELQDVSRAQVEERINSIMQAMSYKSCLGIFSKLIASLGNKDLKQIYNQVAKEIDTPAAKLVSFSINSYYGAISYSELKALAEEFKTNPVALSILRARVKTYVYNRNIDYRTKQQFATCLNMTLGPKKTHSKGW